MLRNVLPAIVLAVVTAIVPAARAGDIDLVLSDKGGVYGEFAAAFEQYLEGSHWRVRWTGTGENLEVAPHADLIVAVGAEAARASLRRAGTPPVIATLLPRQAYERALAEAGGSRPRSGVTAVLLDQPLTRLLAFTRQLLPDRRRVGLLVGPETRSALPALRHAATALGLAVESEEVDADSAVVPALNVLLARTDVLLAQPDGTIYKRDNVRAVLLTSYRFQRPVIAFSQAMVNAGALAAIFSTPAQIARQTADLVRPLHPESALPPPQAPTLFAVAFNANVAQALGLNLPEETAIRRAMGADKEAR